MSVDEMEYDIDFELQFFEGVLQKQPNFFELLLVLGELYTLKGLYNKGLAVDEKLVQMRPYDPWILYNLACSYSLLNEVNKSYRTIKLAIKCGYSDFTHLEKDEDLKNLKNDKRFQRFIQRVEDKCSENLV